MGGLKNFTLQVEAAFSLLVPATSSIPPPQAGYCPPVTARAWPVLTWRRLNSRSVNQSSAGEEPRLTDQRS